MARHYRLARVVWLQIPKQSRAPLLDGDEAMSLLGLAPGPLLGEALRALQEETDALEVTTADQARHFLLQWLARQVGSREGGPTAAGAESEPTATDDHDPATSSGAPQAVNGADPAGSDRA
jgi:hypothetical protein